MAKAMAAMNTTGSAEEEKEKDKQKAQEEEDEGDPNELHVTLLAGRDLLG